MTSISDGRGRAADLGARIQAHMARHRLSRGEMALRRLRWMLLGDTEMSSLAARDIEMLAIATEAFRETFDDFDAGRIARPL